MRIAILTTFEENGVFIGESILGEIPESDSLDELFAYVQAKRPCGDCAAVVRLDRLPGYGAWSLTRLLQPIAIAPRA